VAGFEDLAHAALAYPFQQDIRPQDKLLAFSRKQMVSLVRGEPASFNQLTSECLWVREASLEGVHFLQLHRLQQPVLAKGVYQNPVKGNNDQGFPNVEFHQETIDKLPLTCTVF
jgi:hypothetical protein